MDITPIRILIADDHPVVRAGLRALVDSENGMIVVGESGTGAGAVKLAQELLPDIVIMDISMPGDGLAATRRVHELCPEARVLILTVHSQEHYLRSALKAGASGYVLKSTIDTDLINAIRIVAQSDTLLFPSATLALLNDYLTRVYTSHDQDGNERLSDREREVLRMIALGYTASEIAAQLIVSTKTVETYRMRIMQKLGLHARAALVQYALKHHLLSPDEDD